MSWFFLSISIKPEDLNSCLEKENGSHDSKKLCSQENTLIMPDVLLIDFKQMLEEKLAHTSQHHSLLVVYLANSHASLGTLIQLLKINLTDVLLGKASIKCTDALILNFSEPQEARNIFHTLVREWVLQDDAEQIPVQLWERGKMELEDILGLEVVMPA